VTDRIRALLDMTLRGEEYVTPVKTEFDREDLFLPDTEREIKRICEYILNQEPLINEYHTMTGFFHFDGSVVGDAFNRSGHKRTAEVMEKFYLKAVDNLVTMEWQHATADYSKVLKKGISGIIADIDDSISTHSGKEELEFLKGLRKIAETVILWAHKCSARVLNFAEGVERREYRDNLLRLSEALLRVPERPAESFYEAVLSIYLCFSLNLDSIGTVDRFLAPYYFSDLEKGKITREAAGEYLQELFLLLQAATPIKGHFTKGGQSHFCIGGYLPDGTDGFNDLSRLIIESLTALPTFIPQITVRWTKKMPREAFRFAMDSERRDPHKRIAFTNDEKRIKAYTEICGFPYEKAVGYTMTGCNEPVFIGTLSASNSKINVLRPLADLFHKYSDEIIGLTDFESFWGVFEKHLYSDLDIAYEYDDKFNLARARDVSYVSCLLSSGCIENAKSLTQGGCDYAVSTPMMQGVTNLIDSLTVVKQFVFDERLFTMEELVSALKADWEGYGDMRALIIKKAEFFGNDTERSQAVASRLYESFYRYLKGKRTVFGYPILVGDILGYNIHNKWFGEKTAATPDGRFAGDNLKFGLGQSGGYDREGLTAYLNSVARIDPHGIGCGATVTNVTLDEALIKDDGNFEKTVDLFINYFRMGGVHFQPAYVSREELLRAKEAPDDYKHLRVRVTGFSEYFVKLNEAIQDDIIARTEQKYRKEK